MSRKLTDHKLNGLNEAIEIEVMDSPGSGGANHTYLVKLDGDDVDPMLQVRKTYIHFQNGPIGEAGFNGISNEALLAILIDRMRGFQSGPFASRDNACALTHMEEALMWLQKRTRDRMARGVEGTYQK
ncbi:MAG: DUF7681 family protein [Verrucomicrobiales bacterium]